MIRVSVVAALLLAVFIGSSIASASTGFGPYAYAANSASNSVSVIDTSTGGVVKNISVSGKPYEVATSPDASRIYVSLGSPSRVAVIETSSQSVIANITVGADPLGLAVSPDGTRLYVANQGSNNVSVVNTGSNAVIATVGVGTLPVGVAVSPDNSRVYVTNRLSSSLSVINTASNTLVKNITVGAAPWGVAVRPDGNRVFVSNLQTGTVSVINTSTDTVIATVAMWVPRSIAFTPDGAYAYITNRLMDTVTVVRTSNNSIAATIPVSGGPFNVAITSNGASALVTTRAGGNVTTISTASNTVTGTVSVGNLPWGLAITVPVPPQAPTGVTAVAGNASATVSWTAPVNDGGADITSYAVIANPGGLVAITGGELTANISSLANGTTYTFSVWATNAAGTGPLSAPSNAVTPITIPDAPTSVAATAAEESATVTWAAPAFDGGSAIMGYTVTSNPGGLVVTTAGELTAAFSGLINGTAYTFSVTATNASGTGPLSAPSDAVTPATISDAPTAVVATSGDASATVTWAAPAFDGGSAIIGYTVTSSPGGLVVTTAGELTAAISGLANGTAYTFSITATNAAGTGPASAPSNSVTPITIPDAPMSVAAAAADASATVTWAAPAFDGGSAIMGYTVTSSPDGLVVTTAGELTAAFSGLVNGTSYTFSVTATNATGTGPLSAPSNAVTPTTIPDAPTGVAATAADASATVTWAAPAFDGGSAIMGYTVTSNPGGLVVSTAGELTAAISGLANGTTYTFSVTATNAAGTGPLSAPSNAVTPITIPDAPMSVAATAADASATVTWAAPTFDGGSAIMGYTVTSNPGGLVVTTAGELTAAFSGLVNGTTYTFSVTATNATGTGPLSAPSNAVTPITIPDAPMSVAAAAADASATVTWAAPAFDGGSAIMGYTVTSSPDGLIVATAGELTAAFSGLANGSTYTFSVTATNAAGTGPLSAPSNTVTPITVPDAPTGVVATGGNPSATITWTAPVVDGGSVITGYTVTSSPGDFTVTTAGDVTTATITGLSHGTTYTFTVVATTAAGTGPASDPSNPITPTPPEPIIVVVETDPEPEEETYEGAEFDKFKARVSAKLKRKDNKDWLRVYGNFKFSDDSDVVDLTETAITLEVGEYAIEIEAGSLKRSGKKKYKFKGDTDEGRIRVTIKEKRNGTFSYSISVSRTNLPELERKTELTLKIGNYYGTAPVKIRGVKR